MQISYLEMLRSVMPRNNWLVLDTETTGLDDHAQIVQIAIVDDRGETLLDTLVKPTSRIPAGATAIHGISNEMTANASNWAAVSEQVRAIVAGRDVIIYNSEFDTRLIRQTFSAHGMAYNKYGAKTLTCAMKAYAEYFGAWSDQKGDYSYQKLSKACSQQRIPVSDVHTAFGDCLMTLALVRHIAKPRHQGETGGGFSR